MQAAGFSGMNEHSLQMNKRLNNTAGLYGTYCSASSYSFPVFRPIRSLIKARLNVVQSYSHPQVRTYIHHPICDVETKYCQCLAITVRLPWRITPTGYPALSTGEKDQHIKITNKLNKADGDRDCRRIT